jgi:chromosome segregation ATPase
MEEVLKVCIPMINSFGQYKCVLHGFKLLTLTGIALSLLMTGCNRDPEAKSLDAANSEIEGLQAQIKAKDIANQDMKAEVARLTEELAELKRNLSTENSDRVDAMQKVHTDELLTLKETFRLRQSDLERSLADAQIQLSLSEKTRLSLEGLNHQPERLASIATINNSMERVIWVCTVVASLALSGFFAIHYFNMREQRRHAIVNLIGRYS